MFVPELDQLPGEFEKRFLLFVSCFPIEPADLVVLAIGVVVAILGARPSHRRRSSIGTPWERKSVVRKFRRCRSRKALISGSSVGPSAPQFHELIIIVAVVVLLAVRFVVLVVVADEIVQRESVVRGDKIDARVRVVGRRAGTDPGCPLVDKPSRRSCLRRPSKNCARRRDISRSIPPTSTGKFPT